MNIEGLRTAVDERRNHDIHGTWGYNSRVVESYKVMCVAPPKNGCTATKRVLLSLENPSWSSVSPERFAQVHDAGVTLARYDTDRICELLTSTGWLRFTFVRNPYDRLFSAYKSKIANTQDHQHDWLRSDIRDAFGYPPDGERTTLVSFADYVRYVTETDDPRVVLDGHINQQTNIVAADVIPYDEIGRSENFQQDLDRILERVGAPDFVRSLVTEKVNATVGVPLPYVYDKELSNRVFRRYQTDFDTFGYDRDSWRYR